MTAAHRSRWYHAAKRTSFASAAVLSLLCLSGCGDGYSASTPSGERPQPSKRQLEDQLLAIGQEYLTYSLVDSQANWAPAFCAPLPPPPAAQRSQGDDPATHGDKLYYLLARYPTAYERAANQESPIGQVVVKEAWTSVPASGPTQPEYGKHASGVEVRPFAIRDGKYHHAGEIWALFVMVKTDPQTPGTDAGWLYGTLTPDGQQVTSAGKLANCMGCHTSGTKDRLFGPRTGGP